MSVRLLRPENRLTFENRLTPVMKVNRTWASLSLIVAYRPRRKSRLARATSGTSSASRIGLSYSSTSTATGRPDRSWSASSRPAKRPGAVRYSVATPALRSAAASCSMTFSAKWSGCLKLPLPKLRRRTGCRTDQSHPS